MKCNSASVAFTLSLFLMLVGVPMMTAGPALAGGLSAKESDDLRQAKQLYKSGRYQEAADIFASLSAAHPDIPTFGRNAGAAYYYLKMPGPALSNLREYLRVQKDLADDDRAEVQKWIAEMEQLRAQQPKASPSPGQAQPAPGARQEAVPGAYQQPMPGGYPQQAAPSGYPQQAAPGGYPQQAAPGGYPQQAAPSGYPQQAAPSGYPQQAAPSGYPQQAAPSGYPQQAAPSGYPQQAAPSGYPQQAAPSGYPQQAAPSGYLQEATPGGYPPSVPGQVPSQTVDNVGQPIPAQPQAVPAPVSPPSAAAPGLAIQQGGETRPAEHPKRVAPWIIGGAGVTCLGLGGLFTYLSQSAFSDTRAQYNPSQESAGRTYSYLQFVGYGLGVAGIATAIVLLSMDNGSTPGKVALAPAIGPQMAGAQLHISY